MQSSRQKCAGCTDRAKLFQILSIADTAGGEEIYARMVMRNLLQFQGIRTGGGTDPGEAHDDDILRPNFRLKIGF